MNTSEPVAAIASAGFVIVGGLGAPRIAQGGEPGPRNLGAFPSLLASPSYSLIRGSNRMQTHSRLVAALGCIATLAMVGCATNGGGVTPSTSTTLAAPNSVAAIPNGWHEQNGIMWSTPHYMPTERARRSAGKRTP